MQIKIETKELEELIRKYNNLQLNTLEEATTKYLEATYNELQPQATMLGAVHTDTGAMQSGLITSSTVETRGYGSWHIDWGWKIRDGGRPNQAFHNVYIIHGTRTGIHKDTALYSVLYGAKLKATARKKRKDVFYEIIRKELEK